MAKLELAIDDFCFFEPFSINQFHVKGNLNDLLITTRQLARKVAKKSFEVNDTNHYERIDER